MCYFYNSFNGISLRFMFKGYYNEERLNSWKWKDISLESQIHEYLSIRDKTIEISINKIVV